MNWTLLIAVIATFIVTGTLAAVALLRRAGRRYVRPVVEDTGEYDPK